MGLDIGGELCTAGCGAVAASGGGWWRPIPASCPSFLTATLLVPKIKVKVKPFFS